MATTVSVELGLVMIWPTGGSDYEMANQRLTVCAPTMTFKAQIRNGASQDLCTCSSDETRYPSKCSHNLAAIRLYGWIYQWHQWFTKMRESLYLSDHMACSSTYQSSPDGCDCS